METKSDSAEISKYFIYFLSIFVVGLLIFLYLQGRAEVKTGELADTDGYMRLNRVIQLHESGKWYESSYARSNAPYGENMHWSRPLDALLLAGAWLASPLAGFDKGLFWWGVLISPFLLAASVIMLPWAFRPLLGQSEANLVSVLFLFQVGALGQYYIGRLDHHSLLGFTFIISIGVILRIIQGSFDKKMCYLAGIMGAISMWIHIESMLFIFLSFLVLGIFWIFDDEEFVKKNLHFSISLFIFAAMALLLERPWRELANIEYDKISIVHLFVFGLISFFWIAVFYIKHLQASSAQGRTQRFGIASLGALIVAFSVWFIFPDFYRGGYAHIDQRILSIWFNKVVETQTPLRREFLMPLLQLLGSAAIGIAYIVFSFRKKPDNEMKGWVFILSGILLFASAGIFERRLLLYGNIITLVPLAALLGIVLQWETVRFSVIARSFVRPFTIMAFGAGFLLVGYGCQHMNAKIPVAKKEAVVPLSQMCDELNKLGTAQTRPARILAFIDYGPEILYRTNYEVIATPYHRNAPGILDAYWIMTAESNDIAHAIIHRRGIDMILISTKPTEQQYYAQSLKQSTFYKRLKKDGHINWIEEVPLPKHLSSVYRLFRVVG